MAGFAGFLAIRDRDAAFLFTALIAVISAASIESLILYSKNKKFTLSDSAVISGLIIGFVLANDEPWWKFVLASLLAIGSKYLIRVKKKHLFNPAAFGIFLVTLFLGAETQWRGTFVWYILVPFGLYFTYRIQKLQLVLAYFLTAVVLFATQAIAQKTSLLLIPSYLSYFYLFIMLVEPKTTPMRNFGKIIFGTSVAALIFILIQHGAQFDVELFSLLALNLTTPLLNKVPERRTG